MGEMPLGLLRAADAEIDLSAREVLRGGGGARRLEPRATAVLAALMEAGGSVVGREALLDACWPEGEGSDEALTQAVAQIRRALGDDPRRPRFVGTVHRAGYRWLASVTAAADERGHARPELARQTGKRPGLERVSPPPRRPDWRWAAALSAVALLGAVAGAGAWKAAAPGEPRLQIETEDVVALDGETVRTVREYNGTREEVHAAMAANGETLRQAASP